MADSKLPLRNALNVKCGRLGSFSNKFTRKFKLEISLQSLVSIFQIGSLENASTQRLRHFNEITTLISVRLRQLPNSTANDNRT